METQILRRIESKNFIQRRGIENPLCRPSFTICSNIERLKREKLVEEELLDVDDENSSKRQSDPGIFKSGRKLKPITTAVLLGRRERWSFQQVVDTHTLLLQQKWVVTIGGNGISCPSPKSAGLQSVMKGIEDAPSGYALKGTEIRIDYDVCRIITVRKQSAEKGTGDKDKTPEETVSKELLAACH